ncbi:disintegrin and metalloproteinase domain-containing protein 10-like [Chrysoperla carnea]|uniref:disintegrin and metalloproteinase domain-containing protein 10-like n=1 Tax=Chrysoperla carnea TaxID=189513 RepID=UPI001D07588C|nr:disintegrin and metalloproteinase domain-containing protein 10-like [Chrysoperla carnea]
MSNIKISVVMDNKNVNETMLKHGGTFVEGFDMRNPFTSFVNGYIYCNCFYGRIQLELHNYYVERLHKFPSIMKHSKISDTNLRKNSRCNCSLSIIYDEQDYIGPRGQYYEGNIPLKTLIEVDQFELVNDSISTELYQRRRVTRKLNQAPVGKVCSVLLMGDNTFLYRIAQGDISLATLEMISYLQEAETIFRCTDFNGDGISDNIGFKIKSFMNHVIGVSFTAADRVSQSEQLHAGGICERPTIEGSHLNLLAISTVLDSETRLTQRLIQIALAHEIGHSFGSFHDPDTSECANFLMSASSKPGYNPSNFKFSSCSRRNIAPIISKKSYGCLEPDDEPYCGNEIIDINEDCDCGLYTNCVEKDPCCYPRGSVYQCHVKIDKQCHPSQGLCCLPTCIYRDLKYMGIDCGISTSPKRCPCNHTNTKRCACGYFGQCLGDECHSIECTRIGLTECACLEPETSCRLWIYRADLFTESRVSKKGDEPLKYLYREEYLESNILRRINILYNKE